MSIRAAKKRVQLPEFSIDGISFVPSQIGHRVIKIPIGKSKEIILKHLQRVGRESKLYERGVIIGYMLNPPMPRVTFASKKTLACAPETLIWDIW